VDATRAQRDADDYGGRVRELKAKSKDECRYSATLDGSMECDSTTAAISASQITQQVATLAGQTAMGLSAQSNMAEATSTGSQAAMMNAAAATAEAGGITQLTTGGVNAAMGVMQLALAAKHSKNAKSVQGLEDDVQITMDNGQKTGNADVARASAASATINNNVQNGGLTKGTGGGDLSADENTMAANLFRDGGFKMRSRFEVIEKDTASVCGPTPPVDDQKCAQLKETRARMMATKLERAQDMAREVSDEVQFEQSKKSKEALMSGLQQTFVGASQVTAGYGAMKSAEEMRKAAAQLQDMQGTPFAMPSIDIGAQDAATATAATQSLSGSGETTTAATEEDDVSEEPGALPGPLNLGGPDNTVANAPTPGGFNKGLSTGGGGGGAGLGGGGTSASKLDGGATGSEAAVARTALNNKDKYLANNNSGGGYNAAGGGRGGGGGGGDDMSAFKDMLSQFMPGKKDDAAKDPSMAFGDGRAPASGEGPTSLLGRNVNIFERVSAAYQTKEKSGLFGK